VFQIPVLAFFLAKLGVLSAGLMRRYRRHAVIVTAVVSAVITPPDLFTCCMVIVPMYGLYELSILVVAVCGKQEAQ
jgi:sec-independent protein translocase protein TatC